MNIAFSKSRAPSIFLWILVVGGAGFAAGFLGPITFDPDANQGPLVGILMSGPGGAVLGLLLCAVCRLARVPRAVQWQVLCVSSATLALVTLYYIMPEPALRGYVIDAQVQTCGAPAQSVDAAIEYWEKRVAAVTWAPPRPGWQNDARQRSQEDPGVVLGTTVVRRKGIYEGRKPWDRGRITAGRWEQLNEQKSYYAQYAGDSCADYPTGARSAHFTWNDLSALTRGGGDWPPRELPDFLDLEVMLPVPDEYQKLAGN